MVQVGAKMALSWRQDELKRCLLGVLWPSKVVLGVLMVLGSSSVCFESFLATSWGCLGVSWGVFLDVLRAARVVSGSFLSPR